MSLALEALDRDEIHVPGRKCNVATARLLVSANPDADCAASEAVQCVECHVTSGDPPDTLIPHIGGLPAQYIVTQTLFCNSDKRESLMMKYVADAGANTRDLLHIATFYEGRKRVAGRVEKTEQTELGRQIYASKNFHFCHGMDMELPTECVPFRVCRRSPASTRPTWKR